MIADKGGIAMLDFAKARQTMVDCQIRVNDVTSPRLVGAFAQVPREDFVPDHLKALSYLDDDLCLNGKQGEEGRYMLEAVVLARMIAAAQVDEGCRVLDIGVTTGYSSAVLAAMGAKVVAVEDDVTLADAAKSALAGKAEVVVAPLASGAAAKGPYDAILLQGSVQMIPDSLLQQLAEGGRLVAIKGLGRTARCIVITRLGQEFSSRSLLMLPAHLCRGSNQRQPSPSEAIRRGLVSRYRFCASVQHAHDLLSVRWLRACH